MSTIVKRKFKTGRKTYDVMIERYRSANEVAEDCTKRCITDDCFDDIREEVRKSWHGVSNYDEALELLRHGYQPVVDELRASMREIDVGEGKRISFKNDIVGYTPVVPLALKGVPNSMVNMTMKRIKKKVVDVYYDMTCSSGTEPEKIIEAGSKLLGAILELEQQGYKFNLYALQTYNDGVSTDALVVKMKSSNQPLDLKRMSFPLAHVAFFRVIGFDWYSRCPEAKYRGGYGHALAYELDKKQQQEWAEQMFGSNALYISATEIKDNGKEYLKEIMTNGKNKD